MLLEGGRMEAVTTAEMNHSTTSLHRSGANRSLHFKKTMFEAVQPLTNKYLKKARFIIGKNHVFFVL